MGDQAAVEAAGLKVETEGAKSFFRQPCPRFCCGSCSIYQIRPNVCRTYRCALLKDVESGRLTEGFAAERIAEAKAMVADVRRIDDRAVTPGERTALTNRLRAQLGAQGAADTAGALLKTARLEYFLNRWFLRKEENR